MSISENIMLALAALWGNKMRALLTMLGIIIGIGAVITIFTMGNSLNGYIGTEMASMGANNVTLSVREKAKEDSARSIFGMGGDTIDDDSMISDDMISSLKERFPEEISVVSATISVGSGQATNDRAYANFSLSGVMPDYAEANSITILGGRFLLQREIDAGKNVCVVSEKLVENLGLSGNPLGRQITLGTGKRTSSYAIVGVYEYVSSSFSPGSTSSDKDIQTAVYIPRSTAKKITGSSGYQSITVVTNSGVNSTQFAEDSAKFLNGRFYAKNTKYETSGFSMESIIATMQSMLATLQLAVSSIAAISLLVGGIGVMNIMLVSITERTKEIGTRKAIGASNFTIRMQFITESAIICIIGGIIGIIFGIALGAAGALLLGFPAQPSIQSIVLAVGFSFAIGIFFGYYPANKAALLDPIDALRYE